MNAMITTSIAIRRIRTAALLIGLLGATRDAPAQQPLPAALPPQSPVIKELTWAPKESIVRKARGGDNWPLTWADDGHLYTAYGDGNGFAPQTREKLSLGFARVEGGPGDFTGLNIRCPSGESKGDDKAGKKASGMLMVDGVLYMWARNAGNSQLAWSTNHATTWTGASGSSPPVSAVPRFSTSVKTMRVRATSLCTSTRRTTTVRM